MEHIERTFLHLVPSFGIVPERPPQCCPKTQSCVHNRMNDQAIWQCRHTHTHPQPATPSRSGTLSCEHGPRPIGGKQHGAHRRSDHPILVSTTFHLFFMRSLFLDKAIPSTIQRVNRCLDLDFFIVVHAVRNLHVFKGRDDFNGYGYFCVPLSRTGFGVQAKNIGKYVLVEMRCCTRSLV